MSIQFCEHDKVYSETALLTDPPQYPWICRKCGFKGREVLDVLRDRAEYARIVEKFESTGVSDD